MTRFNSFEEINKAYPLLDGSNERYYVLLNSCYVLSTKDIELEQRIHPYGWHDEYDAKWYYFDINKSIWYDCYIFNGEIWTLGVTNWNEIIDAEEPDWGEHVFPNSRVPFASFKTLAEANDYIKRKLKERLEF